MCSVCQLCPHVCIASQRISVPTKLNAIVDVPWTRFCTFLIIISFASALNIILLEYVVDSLSSLLHSVLLSIAAVVRKTFSSLCLPKRDCVRAPFQVSFQNVYVIWLGADFI